MMNSASQTLVRPATRPVGDLLRDWRMRRRMSQLDLALDAEISTRHLSFVETGRSSPSREMILTLAERLGVPLRERNLLLAAAGFAPIFPQRPLEDPDLAPARRAVELVLKGHEPNPALAVDRHWRMVAANSALPLLLAGVSPKLLEPPVNALRVGLHPEGIAPRIVNLGQWRAHLLERLRQQVEASADAELEALLRELSAYPGETKPGHAPPKNELGAFAVPLIVDLPQGRLSFISTTTIFGTPVDVTLSELAIETFFPADDATAQYLNGISRSA